MSIELSPVAVHLIESVATFSQHKHFNQKNLRETPMQKRTLATLLPYFIAIWDYKKIMRLWS